MSSLRCSRLTLEVFEHTTTVSFVAVLFIRLEYLCRNVFGHCASVESAKGTPVTHSVAPYFLVSPGAKTAAFCRMPTADDLHLVRSAGILIRKPTGLLVCLRALARTLVIELHHYGTLDIVLQN
jgi:hypothetical protein